jgi:cell division protein FtsN
VNGPRLTGRDYKRTRRSKINLDVSRLGTLAMGFAAGLAMAGLGYLAVHHQSDTASATQRPTPRKTTGIEAAGADSTGSDATIAPPTASSESKYDFYQMLPKFEVVIPEKERGSRIAPAAQIDRPGTYFLQVGSYRDPDVADRVHAQLAKLGIEATVQRVAVDADVWRRVRVGPIKDLNQLNRLRQQLRASDLDSLVIRVDE